MPCRQNPGLPGWVMCCLTTGMAARLRSLRLDRLGGERGRRIARARHPSEESVSQIGQALPFLVREQEEKQIVAEGELALETRLVPEVEQLREMRQELGVLLRGSGIAQPGLRSRP
jgi:hypothetical protein